MTKKILKKPDWIKVRLQGSKEGTGRVTSSLKTLNLHTVCQEANCPNKMECYERGTATFMIMGNICTRNCKFCNVLTRKPLPLDPEEPENIAKSVQELNLKHAVITSVDRDDLEDEGANHFAETCKKVKELNPYTTVELLIPDFHARHDLLDIVLESKPDVLNHNMEVVENMHKTICPQSNFENSMEVLRYAKSKGFVTKTGLMLGMGETREDIISLFEKLQAPDIKCDMITIGQYLQPSLKHIEVFEYVHPDIFEEYKKIAYDLGFRQVVSSPFARSSYHADALLEN